MSEALTLKMQKEMWKMLGEGEENEEEVVNCKKIQKEMMKMMGKLVMIEGAVQLDCSMHHYQQQQRKKYLQNFEEITLSHSALRKKEKEKKEQSSEVEIFHCQELSKKDFLIVLEFLRLYLKTQSYCYLQKGLASAKKQEKIHQQTKERCE